MPGYPDWQRFTQWLGSILVQNTGRVIGAGTVVDGPFASGNFASVVIALKATGGSVTVTVKQTVPGGPASLVLSQTVVVAAGATLFEAFVLFGGTVELDLTGSVAGTSVDYALYGSNTTTNAQVITAATINVQKAEVLIAAEPTLDFVDGSVRASVVDDAANTRVKITMSLPPGSILPYAASAAPTGYLLCQGQAVSRATFAALFAAIGTTYGAGDGSTTFNVPDLQGRVPVGLAGAGGNPAVTAIGANDGVALANRRPQHRHTPHSHNYQATSSVALAPSGGANFVVSGSTTTPTTSSDGGSGVATDALDAPANIVLNYIIAT